MNPLCRRKWKLLSASALLIFCPSCKKCIDSALKNVNSDDYFRSVLSLWSRVYTELSCRLNLPALTDSPHLESVIDSGSLLKEYSRCFPSSPSCDQIRNWSSMSQRRRPSISVIEKRGSFICVAKEGHEDFVYFIDWLGIFSTGSKVSLIAFPNPSISERRHIPLLSKAVEKCSGFNDFCDILNWAENKENVSEHQQIPKPSPVRPIGPIISTRPDWIPDTPASPFFLAPLPARSPPDVINALLGGW